MVNKPGSGLCRNYDHWSSLGVSLQLGSSDERSEDREPASPRGATRLSAGQIQTSQRQPQLIPDPPDAPYAHRPFILRA